jgi:hypothetical protein
MERIKDFVPVKSLGILMLIGILDLMTTAWLHANGLIVELNPVMRPIIEHSEWLFALVKGMSLVVAYSVMLSYARTNVDFVRTASRLGVLLYSGMWLIWFVSAM